MLVLVIGDLHLPQRASDLPSKFRKLLVPGKIQQIICSGNVCDRETLDYLRTIAGDVHVVRGDWDENPYFPNSLVIHHLPLRIGVLHGHQIVPPGDVDAQCSLARAMDVDVLVSGHTHRFDAFERDGRFFVNPGSATGAWSSVWPISADPEDDDDKGEKGAGSVEQTEKEQEKAADATGAGPDKKPSDKAKADGSTTEKADAAKEALDKKAGEEEQAKGGDDNKDKKQAPKNAKESKPQATPKEPKAAPEPTPSFALLDIQGAVIVTYVYQLIDGDVKVEKMEFRKTLETGPQGSDAGAVDSAGQRAVGGVRY